MTRLFVSPPPPKERIADGDWSTSVCTVRQGPAGTVAVEAVRGSVYYPPLGLLAQPLARLDRWIGSVTTVGAALIAMAASKGQAKGL